MSTTRDIFLATLLLAAAACTVDETAEQDAALADSASVDTTMGAGAQDADLEFLRRMSDHHQGLVAMGSEAMNSALDDSVKTAAHMLHTKQQAESDSMVAMIRRFSGESYEPKIMPKNQAQADSLKQRTGAEVDRYFIEKTIEHHREGAAMIDEHLPRLSRPEVRAMAEKMRADQQQEITELQARLN